MAQSKRSLKEGYEEHVTEISGDRYPERIPFSTKMGMFCQDFESAYRQRLRGILAGEDVDKIEAFLAGEAEAHERDLEHYYAQTAVVCAELDTLPGSELGAAIAKRDSDLSASREARHRKLFESLSPEARAAVTAILDTEIAPEATSTEIDQVALWTEFPDELREAFRALGRFIPQET